MSNNYNDSHWFCWNLAIKNHPLEIDKICIFLKEIGFEWIQNNSLKPSISEDENYIDINDGYNHIFITLEAITVTSPRHCLVKLQYQEDGKVNFFAYVFDIQDTNGTIIVLKPDITQDISSNESPGVLLSDQIENYVKKYHMIVPFSPENLKAASYNVRIGNLFYRSNKPESVTKDNPFLEIKPHEAVLVRTMEHLHMPRFLIGRWNLRVSKVYKGLVWVGGIHIDPGWKGELWCPIYNLSKETVRLRINEPFASVDFVKTSKYIEGKSQNYVKNRSEPEHPGSGLETLKNDTESFHEKLERFQSNNFTLIGIIVAAIAVLATFSQIPSLEELIKGKSPVTADIWFGYEHSDKPASNDQWAFFFSIFAMVISISWWIVYLVTKGGALFGKRN